MSFDSRYISDAISDILYRPFELPVVAVSSSTWAYPFLHESVLTIQGIVYFMGHPELWTPALSIVVPQVLITSWVFVLVHIWFYPPQAMVALFFNGPTGLITAWIAVMHQSGIISRLIIEKTILPGPLKAIFDTTLRQQGSDALIAKLTLKTMEDKQLIQENSLKPRSQLWRESFSKMYSEWQQALANPYYWLKMLTIIFFNLVPFFGPYVLIFLRSPGKARNLHSRYYAIKKMDKNQVHVFFNANRAYYTSFGLVALNLELIPVFGMFFTFTNIVAASLWAADLEKESEKNLNANKM